MKFIILSTDKPIPTCIPQMVRIYICYYECTCGQRLYFGEFWPDTVSFHIDIVAKFEIYASYRSLPLVEAI